MGSCFWAFLYSSIFPGREGTNGDGIATASLVAFVVLFVLLNVAPYFFGWAMDNIVRLANLIQTVYTLFLLSADIALLVLRKIR